MGLLVSDRSSCYSDLADMTITIEEALSLLRKWQDENRLIQCSLVSSETLMCGLVGRLVSVDNSECRIDASSLTASGKVAGMIFSPSEASEWFYQDYRDAPPEFAQKLEAAYDGQLFIAFQHCHCEIFAMKTTEELPTL
jgi:hypothetical protein